MVGYNVESKNILTQLDYAFAGGASGFITRMICQPLDVLKIRFQLQVEPISKSHVSKYQSIFHATSLIIREEGPKALWKGHVPAQCLSIIYGMAQFWSFEVLTKQVSFLHLPPSVSPLVNFTCGSLAGSIATVASFPFDMVRTRLVAQSEQNKIYPRMFNAFGSMIKQEGFFVLYRGLWPTLLQIAPHAGIQFMTYKVFDKLLVDYKSSTLLNSLISGSLAGFCAKSAIYPLDLAKKRMQIQGFEEGRAVFGKMFKCKGLSDCLVRIYRSEGVAGLFKGLGPSLIKAVCASALHFSSYEMICNAIKKHRLEQG